MFWRVEFNESGAVVSCEPVEEKGKAGGLVAYVEAETKEQASKDGLNWLEKRRAKAREYSQAMRDRRHVEGQCTQHGKPRPCALCKAKNEAHLQRKAAGQLIKPWHTSPATALAAKRAAGLKYRRMLIDVRLVQERFTKLGPAVFAAWLKLEVSAREQGKPVFKRRPGVAKARPRRPLSAAA